MRLPFLLLLALALTACASNPEPAEQAAPASAEEQTAQAADAATPDPSLPVMTVYKTATCGCCRAWVTHLQQNGFRVETIDLPSLAQVKEQYGIPDSLSACHTGVVGGYVVEGHVPAADVRRLLREQPEAAGLAVPGMPIGSPGMEVPGQPAQPYAVYLVEDGGATVYTRH